MKELEQELHSFAKKVVNKAKGQLQRKDKVVSGKLLNSVRYELTKDARGNFTVSFFSTDYGKFVDAGVSGTKKIQTYVDFEGNRVESPFRFGKSRDGGLTRGLDKWIVRRNIKGSRDAKGRFVSRQTMKFFMARKIYTLGIESTSFYSKPLKLGLKPLPGKLLDKLEIELMEQLIT